jgi:hypothetical protein
MFGRFPGEWVNVRWTHLTNVWSAPPKDIPYKLLFTSNMWVGLILPGTSTLPWKYIYSQMEGTFFFGQLMGWQVRLYRRERKKHLTRILLYASLVIASRLMCKLNTTKTSGVFDLVRRHECHWPVDLSQRWSCATEWRYCSLVRELRKWDPCLPNWILHRRLSHRRSGKQGHAIRIANWKLHRQSSKEDFFPAFPARPHVSTDMGSSSGCSRFLKQSRRCALYLGLEVYVTILLDSRQPSSIDNGSLSWEERLMFGGGSFVLGWHWKIVRRL